MTSLTSGRVILCLELASTVICNRKSALCRMQENWTCLLIKGYCSQLGALQQFSKKLVLKMDVLFAI